MTGGDQFIEQLLQNAHPFDRPFPEAWKPYYRCLFELASNLAPKRVCEIGVRAGYSAFTILSANPQAQMVGIDADLDETNENTHGGRKGLYHHALKILAPFQFHLLVVNSHAIQRLPKFDLTYVDGDHTHEGCLSDLLLAAESTDVILVDDYDSIGSVRSGCHAFLEELEIGVQMNPLQAGFSIEPPSTSSGSTTAGPPCLTSHHHRTLSRVR